MPLVTPKVNGGDIELGNFTFGGTHNQATAAETARRLLHHVEGIPDDRTWERNRNFEPAAYRYGRQDSSPQWTDRGYGFAYSISPETRWRAYASGGVSGYASNSYWDWGRKYLPLNGGCVYIDSAHLEVCLPEVHSAFDHCAAYRAMLRVANEARIRANTGLPEGERIVVTANNTDGRVSWGSHINVRMGREAFDRLVYRKPLLHLYLASHQVSSLIWAGQGTVVKDGFLLLQRGRFMESILGLATTYRRPLVNTRDEPLAAGKICRCHCIFYDSNLLSLPCALKVGALQILLAMIETGVLNDANLLLEDPLEALQTWNQDLTLESTAKTASGTKVTAVELQHRFLESAQRCAREGLFEDAIPDLERILSLWQETLGFLAVKDWSILSRRLDWALKLKVLIRAMDQNPNLDWSSDEIRYLDQIYASIDPDEGLALGYEAAGETDELVAEDDVNRFFHAPPEDTRAWTRAALLRRFPDEVERVDWDHVSFRMKQGGSVQVHLPDPSGSTREQMQPIFDRCESLEELTAEPEVRELIIDERQAESQWKR